MTLSHGFRRLATSLEALEANGLEVLDVATTDDEPNRRLTVDLTVSVPFDDGETTQSLASDDEDVNETAPNDATADGTGATADDVSVEASEDVADDAGQSIADVREQVLDPLPVTDDAANGTSRPVDDHSPSGPVSSDSSTSSSANPMDSTNVACPIEDCNAAFGSEHGMKIHRTKVHRHENESAANVVPPYRNPDRLQEVYDECNSFTEMRAALETDVSAQTVRRQMIEHGIYEPGSSNSGSDSSDEHEERTEKDANEEPGENVSASPEAEEEPAEERPPSDDIELPEGVTVATLKTAVLDAKTLYDVQQHFGLDRDETMQLLEKYDLLRIVHGRVSNRDARKQVDEDEITRRILEHVPTGQVSSV